MGRLDADLVPGSVAPRRGHRARGSRAAASPAHQRGSAGGLPSDDSDDRGQEVTQPQGGLLGLCRDLRHIRTQGPALAGGGAYLGVEVARSRALHRPLQLHLLDRHHGRQAAHRPGALPKALEPAGLAAGPAHLRVPVHALPGDDGPPRGLDHYQLGPSQPRILCHDSFPCSALLAGLRASHRWLRLRLHAQVLSDVPGSLVSDTEAVWTFATGDRRRCGAISDS
mmetsp:Transcript_10689/g.25213  ORF Transcript_10689/g.25213 Transcript_10689/m.25213 type:complete len:225 (+) Transcript_10689:3317-3991(+)